jgi:hypothetical protein
MRRQLLPLVGAVSLLVLGATASPADTPPTKADKAPTPLQEKVENADIVLVGKVTQTGLSAASSFDVGAIEVREVLKGDGATKTVHIRIPSRGDSDATKYGKKDVEGVWLLGKDAGQMAPREVLAYLPLTELDAVKKLLPKKEKPVEPPADKKADVKEPVEKKAPAVTVWVLGYERRDANPLADDQFLPRMVEPALAKLKEKGVKKLQFDFKQRQLFVWAEGKQAATLDDIKAAFPVLELKVVAKAAFPEE